MTETLFSLPPATTIPVRGEAPEYPIGRIFCVGRNYAAHAAEMGVDVDREAPFYFTKSPAHAILSGAEVPFASGTENYHHEMELVMAIGHHVYQVDRAHALDAVYAYGCALDMTRRDLQNNHKVKRQPWDLGKDVEDSAVFAPLVKADEFGLPDGKRIHLSVNGEVRQDAVLDDLIWKLDEIVSHLSHYYHLRPGDLILTGTPAGVGPVVAGDVLTGGIDGLEPIRLILT